MSGDKVAYAYQTNELLAAALLELDHRTAPNAPVRPTPIIKAAADALLAEEREGAAPKRGKKQDGP